MPTITLAEDAGWCWFQNPRALVSDGTLWAGYVCSGYRNRGIAGQIRVVEYHFDSGHTTEHTLFQPRDAEEASTWVNDHNAPSLLSLPNGDILAAFTRHGLDNKVHFARVTTQQGKATISRWSWELPPDSRVTYSNLVYLEREQRLYNFFRGLNGAWKPSVMVSDDWGRSWHSYSILVDVEGETRKQRPYMLVSSDGVDTIDFVFTDDHPRNFPNSLYFMKYESGKGLSDGDGSPVGNLEKGISHPSKASIIHPGSTDAVAWPIQLSRSNRGEPQVLYQLSSHRNRASGETESIIDYWLATQKTHKWRKRFVANAGSQLYKGEDDYSGLAALIPHSQISHTVVSTKKDPNTSLPSASWHLWLREESTKIWTALDESADGDQHRPIIIPTGTGSILLWTEGVMESFRRFRYLLRMRELPLTSS